MRPTSGLAVRALQAGALLVSTLFVVALGLELLASPIADQVATIGVLALIATPALGLAATAVESRRTERTTALLALAVLGVLGAATLVALYLGL